MQLIAIDYGTKNVGIAVGHTTTKTFSPLTIISYKSHQNLLSKIKKVIDEWEPQMIIIGCPSNMDESESEMQRLVNSLIKKLEQKFNIPVTLHDERLSSSEARALSNDTEKIDDIAAMVILKSWIENNEHS